MADEPRLLALLARWLELRQQGQAVSAEALCADCPELGSDLRRRIEALTTSDASVQSAPTLLPAPTAAAPSSVPTQPDPGAAPPPDWSCLPAYEVHEVVGRGGMGVV